jgi:hypothetical protein
MNSWVISPESCLSTAIPNSKPPFEIAGKLFIVQVTSRLELNPNQEKLDLFEERINGEGIFIIYNLVNRKGRSVGGQ